MDSPDYFAAHVRSHVPDPPEATEAFRILRHLHPGEQFVVFGAAAGSEGSTEELAAAGACGDA